MPKPTELESLGVIPSSVGPRFSEWCSALQCESHYSEQAFSALALLGIFGLDNSFDAGGGGNSEGAGLCITGCLSFMVSALMRHSSNPSPHSQS